MYGLLSYMGDTQELLDGKNLPSLEGISNLKALKNWEPLVQKHVVPFQQGLSPSQKSHVDRGHFRYML